MLPNSRIDKQLKNPKRFCFKKIPLKNILSGWRLRISLLVTFVTGFF
jgi:hypothetical protein